MARMQWILIPAAALAVAAAGAWVLIGATGRALHPNPEAIESVARDEPSPRWADAVDRARSLVRTEMAGQGAPGVSAAVGFGGEIVWAEGFGWADVESGTPVTPNVRFRIGTASRALTSAAVGVLLEQGRLTLDDEIQTYVPDFPKKQWPVTLRQLMADMGGVGSDDGDDAPLLRERCEQPAEALPSFADNPLLFQPGTRHRQSNYGWIVVSAAVEAASKRPYLDFMGEKIFRPLGMDNTGAESASEENPERIGEPAEDAPILTLIRQVVLEPLGLGGVKVKEAREPATIYAPGFGYDPLIQYGMHVIPTRNLSCYAGSMALFATPSDLVRFGLAIHGGALLQARTVEALQTSQLLASGETTGHGLGWSIESAAPAGEPMRAAGLDGELSGRRVASLKIYREAGIVVAVASNMAETDTSILALKLAEAFAQAPPM